MNDTVRCSRADQFDDGIHWHDDRIVGGQQARRVPARLRAVLVATLTASEVDVATRQARSAASAFGVIGVVLAFAAWKVVGAAIQVEEMRAAVVV